MALRCLRSAALIIATIVPATGCSIVYRPPSIAVMEATVTERTDEALRLDIELALSNPNDEPLELREFVYEVSLDGESVYTGRRAAEATLSARSEKRIALPAVIRFDGLKTVPGAAGWSVRGSVLYLTPTVLAEILLDADLYEPRAGFQGDGQADLR